MTRLSRLITYDKEFGASISTLEGQFRAEIPLPTVINGLTGGALTAYLAEAVLSLRKVTPAPALVLTDSDTERDKTVRELTALGVKAVAFCARDLVFHNISASHDRERERISVLGSVLSGECDCVVSTPSAASVFTLPTSLFKNSYIKLRVGDTLSPLELSEKLDALGFVKVALVENSGQYAKRGGIVDFFGGDGKGAVRVEFFGDEIDRIVNFDIITQRAKESISEAEISPAVEVALSSAARERVLKEARRLLDETREENAKISLRRDIAALEGEGNLLCRDKYIGLIYPERQTLFSYISDRGRAPVFIIGSAECEKELDTFLKSLGERKGALISHGLVGKSYSNYALSKEEYKSALAASVICHLNTFAGIKGAERLAGLFGFRCRRCVAYGKNISMFTEDIRIFKSQSYRIVIQCETRAGVKSVLSILEDNGYTAGIADDENFDFSAMKEGQIVLTVGGLEGFDLIMGRCALISMAEDEGSRVMANRRRQRILKKAGGAQRIMSHADLSVGDYIVHANYGIGLFEGIKSVRVDGVLRDYITIRYAGTDKLFVPCDRLEMIGKYIGDRASDGSVKLSRMGGADWNKTKAKAKSSARDIAKKLISLYAERQRSEGFAFDADSEMEDEFAEGFPFSETYSQIQAIEEIKADMMRPVPMNRLLCGDVGFGKTEVALRAAFKAVMSGKQVAFLVPTTILALQHYQTALSRMRGYPVTVEMLSRFRTPKEQREILEGCKRGSVDILIGTHKMLSKKLEFRDLGLLIIDEEQRFGVAQKEKIKEMRANIDVLTLSATPIPRTLNMAMNGIADMSVLDEAPEDRRPPQTYVLEHDEAVIYDAINRELSRGGQVLYLYNNTETIDFTARKIMTDIPSARVAYAHGQMDKDDLEDIWGALVRGDIDILVCTTIIETGVDLPNANTLIIENADRMGLSQLHQIRGRVGRSNRQAYAYFTYRPGKALSEVATKRLSAIREYAEFGAGFKVALRDLEIRGAGNLLGSEQHGYIDSVGYDLYVKLLSEAVAEEKGEAKPKPFEAHIDIKTDAHIPEYYISSSAVRMEIYKKISLISTPEDKDDIYDELADRFGDLPKTVTRLLDISLSRAIAERVEISRVEKRNNLLLFHMQKCDLAVWSEVLEKHKGRLFGGSSEAPIIYRLAHKDDAAEACRRILVDYYNALEE